MIYFRNVETEDAAAQHQRKFRRTADDQFSEDIYYWMVVMNAAHGGDQEREAHQSK